MSHPFEKILEKAIAKSHGDENHVLGEAERLMGLGYAPLEIYTVLKKLKNALIIEADETIVAEAIEEFSQSTQKPFNTLSQSEKTKLFASGIISGVCWIGAAVIGIFFL